MRLFGIPDGLTHRKCKKYDPKVMGGHPPIRYLPKEAIEDEEVVGRKVNTVEIEINSSVTKKFMAFVKGEPEDVIQLIRNHESLVKDKKLLEKYIAASALWDKKKKAIEDFAQTSDKTHNKAQLKILNKELKEHKSTYMRAQEDAFD